MRLVHLVHTLDPTSGSFVYNIRRPRSGDKSILYNPSQHFEVRETSTFLDSVMPVDYVQVTWDTKHEESIEEAEHMLVRGISEHNVPGWDLGEYRYFTGTCRDHIKAVFIPRKTKLSLRDIGITMQPTSKAAKYLNRLLAPHEYSVIGSVLESKDLGEEGDHLKVSCKGLKLDILVKPDHQLCDGAHLCTSRFGALVLGMSDPNTGDAVKVTGATPFGLIKGHMMIADHIKYDAIVYGPKSGLKYDNFFFGRLAGLHIGRPYSDFQSLINFLMHGHGSELIEAHAMQFFEDVMLATEDADRMRKLFLGFSDLDEDSDWVMVEALKRDIDGIFPGLYRRQAKMLMSKVFDCGLGRVPLHNSAVYAYVMPPPDMFEADGTPNPARSRFRGNCVFSPLVNREQEIAMYRQPNGNPREHWRARTVAAPFRNMGQGRVVYLSPDIIEESLSAMGGGDFDDSVVLVHNPKLVEIFDQLPSYPAKR
jgi:hypothetical protein